MSPYVGKAKPYFLIKMIKNHHALIEELDNAIALHPNSSNIKGMEVSPEMHCIMRSYRKLTVKTFPDIGVKPAFLDALCSIPEIVWERSKESKLEFYQHENPEGEIQDIPITIVDLDGIDFKLPPVL